MTMEILKKSKVFYLILTLIWLGCRIKTLRSEQNGCHFADDIFKCIFLKKKTKKKQVRVRVSLRWCSPSTMRAGHLIFSSTTTGGGCLNNPIFSNLPGDAWAPGVTRSSTAMISTFKTRQPLPIVTLWKTQIMYHLDYCSQSWSPNKKADIQSLELLQKASVREIRGISALSYWDQIIKLKLYSLERHRERYQVIYTWRTTEGHVPNFSCIPIQSYENSRRGPLVLLVLSRQSGFLLSLSRGPACSICYPSTCGICLAALLRGLSVNWTATRLLYQTSPWSRLPPVSEMWQRFSDQANSPYLHQQDNQLQQHNYPELDEAVTMWRPVGSHKHYRVRVPTNKSWKISMIFQWSFKTKIPNFHDNSERYKTEKHRTTCYTWSPHTSYGHYTCIWRF